MLCALSLAAGETERSERLAAPIKNRVLFLGRVPDVDLAALYGCADVFAMLCRDRWGGVEAEGFGIVFLEAAACGLPVVAGRSGGSHEAVADGKTGYVVDPRNLDDITSALERLVTDRARRVEYGEAARARAVRSFNYDDLAAPVASIAMGDLSCFERRPE